MTRYSVFSLIKQGLIRHTGWKRAWRDAEPKAAYDVIIIGGGGHGLATAYYLAKLSGGKEREGDELYAAFPLRYEAAKVRADSFWEWITDAAKEYCYSVPSP